LGVTLLLPKFIVPAEPSISTVSMTLFFTVIVSELLGCPPVPEPPVKVLQFLLVVTFIVAAEALFAPKTKNRKLIIVRLLQEQNSFVKILSYFFLLVAFF